MRFQFSVKGVQGQIKSLQLDSMRWFPHRRGTGGRHSCITYLLTDVVPWPTATPATPTCVCWYFSVVTQQTATFWDVGPRNGPMTPKFELWRDFCTVQVSSSYI